MSAEGVRFFEASIEPSNVSLTIGQIQTFTVHCYPLGGISPSSNLNYSWSYFTPTNISVSVNGVQARWNGSGTFTAGGSFSFSFLSACAGLRLSVHVVDNDPSSALYGGCGDASASVFDPYGAPSVYLDAFPIGTVVEADGSGWYRYTTNGQQKFSSTNASKAFEFAIGNTTSGKIFVKTGAYQIDTTITISHTVNIEGESWGIVAGTSLHSGAMLSLTTPNIPLFNITSIPKDTWNAFSTLDNLDLYGNHLAGTVGILVYGLTSDNLFQRLFVHGFGEAAFKFTAHNEKTWNNWIRQCDIEDQTTGYGIYFTDSTSYSIDIERVSVMDECHFNGNLASVYCDTPYVYNFAFSGNTVGGELQSCINSSYGNSWIISNNRIYDCGSASANTYGAIFVNGSGTNGPNYWNIYGNTLQNTWTDNMNFSVWLTGLCRNFEVYGNNLAYTSSLVLCGIRTDGLSSYSYGVNIHDNSNAYTTSPYSFIVDVDEQGYYRALCSNGTLLERSANASKVFQFAVGNSTNNNLIYVKNGVYNIDTTITITEGHCVTFQGESQGWTYMSSTFGTCLNLTTAGIPLFNLSGPAGWPLYIPWNVFTTFSDLWLQGNYLAGTTGILISNGTVSDVFLRRCYVSEFGRSGLEVRAHGGKVWNIWVESCLFERMHTGYGIYLTDTTNATSGCIDRVSIYKCHFNENINSLRIDSDWVYNSAFYDNTAELEKQDCIYATNGRSISVTNNRIFDCGSALALTYGGLFINGTTTGLYPLEWIIEGNTIHDHFYPGMAYGAWITGRCEGFIVTHNIGPNFTIPIKISGLILSQASNNIIKDNNAPVPYEDVSGYSYLVFTDGSTYYMRNGSTGRVDFSSANASQVINNADGNVTNNGIIFMRGGTYQIADVSLSNAAHWIGEDGCVWNLTYKPCLTINAATIFENIQFYSALDGNSHIQIKSDVTFLKVNFTFPLGTGELTGVMENEASLPNTVKFESCTLNGGIAGKSYFTLFSADAASKTLIIDGFMVEDVIADTTDGRIAVFVLNSPAVVDYIYVHDVYVKHIDTIYTGSNFLKVYSASHKLIIDGFIFDSGNWHSLPNSYFQAFGITLMDEVILSNMVFHDRMHMIVMAKHLTIDNIDYLKSNITDTYSGGIDLGATNFYPCDATINNVHITGGSLDMNSGWRQLTLTNSIMQNGRVNLLDESGAHLEKNVAISNVLWWHNASYTGSVFDGIEVRYDQGLNLKSLQISNCRYYVTLLGIYGSSQYPSNIMMDNINTACSTEYMVYSHNGLISGDARSDGNATVSLFNSRVHVSALPLGDWTPLSTDRLVNDQIILATTNVTYYTEKSSLAINATATTFTITHGLVATPTFVSCSFNSTQIDGWAWTSTSSTITVTVHNRVTTDAIVACYWEAKYQP
jgi:hypothetical protein